jgi:hypothetical protein
MERYTPGKYVKFNNNAGFVNETVYTATLNASDTVIGRTGLLEGILWLLIFKA